MNKINLDRDEMNLEILRNCFIIFCEYNFADDQVIQDYIKDIRYFEDKIDDKNSRKNINEFIDNFNKGK